ncbi:class I SAM-dependent methyltransferase [Mesorhizobium sp. B2-1-8]|uniref:class I SAM-dependent methyltransferase n=1 Tax=Mesorhizobium sp. B2-1-8 TaxID=2589967 RepID=UPI001128C698|nr:class I SAM-dependent methyltransferase [Mesorhizobium sp. B2-1-8]UCI18504.1 class I SAM-dependent methyltransferase [Mesorhizobium sp. B2-1-8]
MHETLDEIGGRHGTDKRSDQNNFLNFYDRFLGPLREKPVKLLEIGVLDGDSVRTWQDYFRNGKIVGVDIDPGTKAHEQDRIRIEILDQSKVQDLDLLVAKGPFDIIVDDGSHVWTHQILTFQKLIGTVTPGGFYIVEDLDTSYGKYVPHYHGGATESAAAYLQRLARLVVGQRVLNLTEEPDAFQQSLFPRIDFITFYRGAALVRLKE